MQYLVPDTSVAIDGRISARVKSGDLAGKRIVIPIDRCRRAGGPRSTTAETPV